MHGSEALNLEPARVWAQTVPQDPLGAEHTDLSQHRLLLPKKSGELHSGSPEQPRVTREPGWKGMSNVPSVLPQPRGRGGEKGRSTLSEMAQEIRTS